MGPRSDNQRLAGIGDRGDVVPWIGLGSEGSEHARRQPAVPSDRSPGWPAASEGSNRSQRPPLGIEAQRLNLCTGPDRPAHRLLFCEIAVARPEQPCRRAGSSAQLHFEDPRRRAWRDWPRRATTTTRKNEEETARSRNHRGSRVIIRVDGLTGHEWEDTIEPDPARHGWLGHMTALLASEGFTARASAASWMCATTNQQVHRTHARRATSSKKRSWTESAASCTMRQSAGKRHDARNHDVVGQVLELDPLLQM